MPTAIPRGLVLAFSLLTMAPAQQPLTQQMPAKEPTTQEAPTPEQLLATAFTALGRQCTGNPALPPNEAAWCMLAFLGNGSTMRSGPHRNAIKVATAGLRATQDDNGHFLHGGERCDLRAQIVATIAMGSAYGLSNYSLLKPNSLRAVAAVRTMVADTKLTIEDAALLGWLLEVARTHAFVGAATATEMESAVRKAMAGYQRGSSRRGDAAFQLVEILLGAKPPADLVVAQVWPRDVGADALHTLLAVLALARTDAQAKKVRGEQWEVLQGLLARRVPNGEGAELWAASGSMDALTTSAMFASALAVAERSVR